MIGERVFCPGTRPQTTCQGVPLVLPCLAIVAVVMMQVLLVFSSV